MAISVIPPGFWQSDVAVSSDRLQTSIMSSTLLSSRHEELLAGWR